MYTCEEKLIDNEFCMVSAKWCLEALGTKQDGAASVAFAQKGASQINNSQI